MKLEYEIIYKTLAQFLKVHSKENTFVMVKNRRIDDELKAPSFLMRHVQCLLLFCGTSVIFALRVNLSVAIVAMTDNSANPNFEEFHWSERIKSVLLSSFFWGYICTQVPAGVVAVKFGGKVMLLSAVFNSSLISIILPYCAELGGWKLMCALRVLQGITQGVTFPSCHSVLSKWAPPDERGILAIYTYSGSQLGTVFMLAASGYLASSPLGWPSTFYIPGVIGLMWCVAMYKFGASSPADCKYISEVERKYIHNSLFEHSSKEDDKNAVKFPWGRVLSSLPFLALIFTHCSSSWGFWTLLTQIPNYMKNVLKFDIKSNALLSAMPYFISLVLGIILSGVSSLINKYDCMSLSTSRKFFNTLALWIPAITLCILGYVDAEHSAWAITLLTITIGSHVTSYLGFAINHMDLSPNFAGMLMGITNFSAAVMSIFAPLVVGEVVTDVNDITQWRMVFFIAGGFSFLGNLVFIIFGSTEVQSWNNPQPKHQIVPTSEEQELQSTELQNC